MNRRYRNRLWMPLIAVILLSSFAQAQTIHTLAIQDALDLAKKNNIAVKQAINNLNLQVQDNREVTAQALPTVSGTGSSTGYFSIPVTLVPGEFFGGPPGSYLPVQFQQKYAAAGGVSLTQTLFDGSVFVGLKARQSALDFYKKGIDITIEDLSVQVYKTYYQLVVSKTQVQLQDSNIARAEKLLHDTRILNENGFAEKLDVDKSAVQLANLITNRQNSLTNIVNGYLQLKFLIGIPAADSVILKTDLTENEIKGGIPMDAAYNYKDRNDYQQLEIQQQLSEFDIKRYRAAFLPILSLNGAYQKNAANNTYDFFTKSGTWYTASYVGLSLNVPIFDGFAKDARLKKAKLRSGFVNDQIENLKLNINLQVASSKNDFINAIQTMDFQQGNMKLAESVYNQTKKKFESGLSTNTDLSNAQQDLITAQVNYINATYNAVVAKVNFLKAIGKI